MTRPSRPRKSGRPTSKAEKQKSKGAKASQKGELPRDPSPESQAPPRDAKSPKPKASPKGAESAVARARPPALEQTDTKAQSTRRRQSASKGGKAGGRAPKAPAEVPVPELGFDLRDLAPDRVERAEDMGAETFEFLAAVDDYKRRALISHLAAKDYLTILERMGYRGPNRQRAAEIARIDAALSAYRRTYRRLFPGLSEVFALLQAAGYRRAA